MQTEGCSMADDDVQTSLSSAIVSDGGETGPAVCKREMELEGDADCRPSPPAIPTPPLQSEESEVCARYMFNTRCQEAGESIDVFVAILTTLSSCCNFQHLRDGLIRDRVIVGVRSPATRERLLRHPKLTLQSALDICRQAEDESNLHGEPPVREQLNSQTPVPGEDAVLKTEEGNSLPDPQVSMETDRDTALGRGPHPSQRETLIRMGSGGCRQKQTAAVCDSGGEGKDARGGGGKRHYPCPDCGRVFQYRSFLLRHLELPCQTSPPAASTSAAESRPLPPRISPRVGVRRTPSQPCADTEEGVNAGETRGADRGGDRSAEAEIKDKGRMSLPRENTRTGDGEGSRSKKAGTAKHLGCEVCGKTFVYKRGLLNHRKKHAGHGDSLARQDRLVLAGGEDKMVYGEDKMAGGESGSDLEAGKAQDSGRVAARQSSSGGAPRSTGARSANSDLEDETLGVAMEGGSDNGDSGAVHTGGPRQNSESGGEKPLRCDLCGKGFGYPRNMLKHRARHLMEADRYARRAGLVEGGGGEREGEQGGLAQLEATSCHLCGKMFSKPRYLDRHLLTHAEGRQFECEFCGKTFKTKAVLADHQLCHTGREACTCSYCGRAFAKRAYLKKHERLHTGELPYECQHCGRRFHLSSGLHFHLLSHSGERRHKCDICGKGFSRYTILKKHLIIHSNSRPFSCNVCKKSFKSRNELARHELIHKGVKGFICHLCGAGFIRSTHMWQHMRHHHRHEESKWQKRDARPSVSQVPATAAFSGACTVSNPDSDRPAELSLTQSLAAMDRATLQLGMEAAVSHALSSLGRSAEQEDRAENVAVSGSKSALATLQSPPSSSLCQPPICTPLHNLPPPTSITSLPSSSFPASTASLPRTQPSTLHPSQPQPGLHSTQFPTPLPLPSASVHSSPQTGPFATPLAFPP